MLLDEAIHLRRSVRAYLDKPVERSVIEEILTLSRRAPSWGNWQPVELAVVGGDVARSLAREFVESLNNNVPSVQDFEMPGAIAQPYWNRIKTLGKKVFEIKGINRADINDRAKHAADNFSGFGAPNFIYLMIDESLTTIYPIFDAGIMAAHICLAAASRGLGTVMVAALAMYPDIIRRRLGLPKEKKIILGISIGYEDQNAPINQLKTDRLPLEETVTWVGMD